MWLVVPGVRSSYSRDGAVLLDLRHGHYYTLNAFAARVWATIETSPSGIDAEDIVDVLETHFEVSREALMEDALRCLEDLQRAGLVREGITVSDEASADHASSLSRFETRVRESRHEGGRQVMIHEHQFVQRFETSGSLVDQLFRQGLENHIDWRAKKLKDFIDADPPKARYIRVGEICSALELSLSARQARRLFRESAGISINEYARKRRLALAAKQLQDTGDPIKVIAADAGYQTQQGFARRFYEMFGSTPIEFRRMWQRSQDLA
jgi:AraC-like DNA-binding protein